MKQDEPFDPSVKSKNTPPGLIFRCANRADCNAISDLMIERNPSINPSQLIANTNREIDRLESDNNYKLYVAELNKEVVGFCRFYHSSGLPAHIKMYPSPEEWYGMGIMVSSKFRRQKIAEFLSLGRVNILKKMGVKEFYSIVDSNNLTSMKMHKKFGYKEISKADGFLHLKFEEGYGRLFLLAI